MNEISCVCFYCVFPFLSSPFHLLRLVKRKEMIKEKENAVKGKEHERERCSGSYCQAVGFLVIKDDSISERRGK